MLSYGVLTQYFRDRPSPQGPLPYRYSTAGKALALPRVIELCEIELLLIS